MECVLGRLTSDWVAVRIEGSRQRLANRLESCAAILPITYPVPAHLAATKGHRCSDSILTISIPSSKESRMATNDVETEQVDTKNVIRRHFKRLSRQLAVSSDLLLSVSVGFYQCNIIDQVTKAEINSKGGLVGADILLTHIDMKVEQSPNDYLVPVMNVLRDEVALRDTVRKMEADYLAGRPSSDSSATTSEAAMGKEAEKCSQYYYYTCILQTMSMFPLL